MNRFVGDASQRACRNPRRDDKIGHRFHREENFVMTTPPEMTAGVTREGSSVEGLVWNILGQTYTPLQVTESSFSWHALLPPGTFVPPHIHPTQ
jgi:hypothetical protein